MKKHNLILVAFFSLTMATGCYNGHILEKPITMLANDKKTALTPPLTYDSSIRLHNDSPIEWGAVWTRYYTSTSVEGVGFDRLLLENYNTNNYKSDISLLTPIWSTDLSKNIINIDINLVGVTPITQFSGNFYEIQYGVATLSNVVNSFDLIVDNPSPYPIRIYLDISSNGAGRLFSVYYNNIIEYGYVAFYYDAITSYFVPPFTKIQIRNAVNNFTKLDALYFDILPLSDGMIGFASENYDSGFGGGFDEGWRSVDNLQWLENVATAVKDIFSVEIFPGFTVGFIVLFPLVVAIVKWFFSLFGIGGGS